MAHENEPPTPFGMPQPPTPPTPEATSSPPRYRSARNPRETGRAKTLVSGLVVIAVLAVCLMLIFANLARSS